MHQTVTCCTSVASLMKVSLKGADLAVGSDKMDFRTGRPGVDVMVTNFCDFLSKKLAFFLNANFIINFFSTFSFVLIQKRQFFRKIFR
jgi:hypothetical protein